HCQSLRVGFEPDDIVHASHGQSAQVAPHAGLIMVQQRSDVDNFGYLPAHEFGNEGFASHAGSRLAQFEITPNRIAEDWTVVRSLLVIPGLGAASDAYAVSFCEFEEACVMQILALLIPNDNLLSRQSGTQQAFNQSRNNCRSGATVWPRR